jgi:hypothetical protein
LVEVVGRKGPYTPSYTVTIVNEHFSQTGKEEARDNIEAWKSALSTAIEIAGDQVSHGNPFFGAEVTLAQGTRGSADT